MLDKLAKYHNEWLKILYSFGCGYDDAQDIVQDMYLNFSKWDVNLDKIKYKDTINKFYIYTTLKNMYLQRLNKQQITTEFTEEILTSADEPYNEDRSEAMDKILNSIFDDISKLTTFETRLFELYWDLPLNPNVTYSGANRSQRDIAFGSDVSLTTIHKHLKRIKDQLVDKYAEDVEDYFNSDYDKI
jgi:RNA polymerase sigma factor (sigma-70 family)